MGLCVGGRRAEKIFGSRERLPAGGGSYICHSMYNADQIDSLDRLQLINNTKSGSESKIGLLIGSTGLGLSCLWRIRETQIRLRPLESN